MNISISTDSFGEINKFMWWSYRDQVNVGCREMGEVFYSFSRYLWLLLCKSSTHRVWTDWMLSDSEYPSRNIQKAVGDTQKELRKLEIQKTSHFMVGVWSLESLGPHSWVLDRCREGKECVCVGGRPGKDWCTAEEGGRRVQEDRASVVVCQGLSRAGSSALEDVLELVQRRGCS